MLSSQCWPHRPSSSSELPVCQPQNLSPSPRLPAHRVLATAPTPRLHPTAAPRGLHCFSIPQLSLGPGPRPFFPQDHGTRRGCPVWGSGRRPPWKATRHSSSGPEMCLEAAGDRAKAVQPSCSFVPAPAPHTPGHGAGLSSTLRPALGWRGTSIVAARPHQPHGSCPAPPPLPVVGTFADHGLFGPRWVATGSRGSEVQSPQAPRTQAG